MDFKKIFMCNYPDIKGKLSTLICNNENILQMFLNWFLRNEVNTRPNETTFFVMYFCKQKNRNRYFAPTIEDFREWIVRMNCIYYGCVKPFIPLDVKDLPESNDMLTNFTLKDENGNDTFEGKLPVCYFPEFVKKHSDKFPFKTVLNYRDEKTPIENSEHVCVKHSISGDTDPFLIQEEKEGHLVIKIRRNDEPSPYLGYCSLSIHYYEDDCDMILFFQKEYIAELFSELFIFSELFVSI